CRRPPGSGRSSAGGGSFSCALRSSRSAPRRAGGRRGSARSSTPARCAGGAPGSLGAIVAAGVLQGVGGGALQPIAQAVLLESFPPARRGVAMAVFSMGIIVAPILGPTLGGFITDEYSWRWIFYINLRVGAVAILMAQAFIEDPPY